MISEMRIYLDKSVQIHPKENINTVMCQEKMSYNYHVRFFSGKETKLCRTAFLSVHGLKKNEGSLKSILKQRRQA